MWYVVIAIVTAMVMGMAMAMAIVSKLRSWFLRRTKPLHDSCHLARISSQYGSSSCLVDIRTRLQAFNCGPKLSLVRFHLNPTKDLAIHLSNFALVGPIVSAPSSTQTSDALYAHVTAFVDPVFELLVVIPRYVDIVGEFAGMTDPVMASVFSFKTHTLLMVPSNVTSRRIAQNLGANIIWSLAYTPSTISVMCCFDELLEPQQSVKRAYII
jgi:hypothetical protein